ncbi:MAG: GWxTD domain-containing protein [Rhodothermales bacterium]
MSGKREKGRGKRGLGSVVLIGMLGALALTLPPKAGAQDRYVDLSERYDRPRLYHEAFALPGDVQPTLVVAFRIPNAMLVFMRAQADVPGGAFVAQAEVVVEVYQKGERLAEQRWQWTHHAADFEATQHREMGIEGHVRFALNPGFYAYRLRIQDGNSVRSSELDVRSVRVPDFGGSALGKPMIVEDVQTGGADVRLRLANLGGAAPFGQPAQAVVPLGLVPDVRLETTSLGYALYRQEAELTGRGQPRGEATPVRRAGDGTVLPPVEPKPKGPALATGTVAGAAFVPVPPLKEPVPPLKEEPTEGGALAWSGDALSAKAGYLARIPLGDHLAEGGYVLEMTLQEGAAEAKPLATLRTSFRVHWRGQPVSLYSPVVAIRNLEFIESRDAVGAMLKGSREEREARLNAYWAERDPTPGTVFNELMAEYYRRVDYAADAFRTGLVPAPDGLQTDQARVYIVHGPPESVERRFPSPGGVEETWTYADGRQFVFRAATSFDAFELERRGAP